MITAHTTPLIGLSRMPPAAQDLRLAFFITSYQSPEQLSRLTHTLRRADPAAPIVIHHDAFRFPFRRDLIEDLSGIHVLTSEHPIVWGDMTLESVRWRVFRWIQNNLSIDWVVLLSEQDYPVAPVTSLKELFASSDSDAFIEGQRLDDITDQYEYREYFLRYFYRHFELPAWDIESRLPQFWHKAMDNIRLQLERAVARLSLNRVRLRWGKRELGVHARIGFRRRRTPFSADFPCWTYNCWFALSKNGIDHVIAFLDANPQFSDYYQNTIIPLESATGTIIFNDPELICVNTSLHAIRWSNRESGRPDVYEVSDLDFLRDSGFYFARKFDATDEELLDELDRIIFADTSGDM